MGKYEEFSKRALKALGGLDNIENVVHCITRLRVTYKSKEAIDFDAMENLPECAGLVKKDHVIQFIIGPSIDECYQEFITVSGWKDKEDEKAAEEAEKKANQGPRNARWYLNQFSNFVAPVFMDIVPALSVGGMILALKTLLVNYFGVSIDSGAAQLMMCVFSAAFNYIPIYLGYSLSKKLNMPPILGMLLGGVMVCQRFLEGNVPDFFGIPVPQVDYTSTIIPIVLGVFLMYFVYKYVKKIMPEVVTFFLTPLVTMIIVVPLTLIVLGPIGYELSDAVGNGIVWLTDRVGFISQPILCVAYPYMVMLGIDKAIEPLQLNLIATLGYDAVTGPLGLVSNLCVGASALAVATMTKNKAKKGATVSFGITGLCGVTEPAFYGCLIENPRALIGTAIGAACAGLFEGIFGLRAFVPTSCSGLLTYLNFLDTTDGSLHYIIIAVITSAIAIVVSFVAVKVILTYDAKKAAREEMQQTMSEKEEAPQEKKTICEEKTVYAPVTGKVVPLESVKDEAFASGTLGAGVGIEPEEEYLCAPVDGVIEVVFPTGHAIGIKSADGMEILLRVGVDTVEMNGKGFQTFVEQGNHVKAGELLLKFSRKEIQAAGHEATTFVLVSNDSEIGTFRSECKGRVKKLDKLFSFK